MVTREISYKSSEGIRDIYAYIWEPEKETEIVGILQICHGMAEHGRRYDRFASFLNSKGFVVCTNDNLGHGKSAAGKYGHIGEKNGHKYLAKDAYKLTNIMKKEYGKLPYVIMGHSMGSLIARYVCSLWGLEYNGAIFSGTSGGNADFQKPVTAFINLMCNMGKASKESKMIQKVVLKAFNKKFRADGGHWATKDLAELEAAQNDTDIGFAFTYGGYRDMFKLLSIVSGKAWAERMPKNLPVYIFSGLDDPVGGFGKGVIRVYEMLVNAGCFNVEIKLYENGRHEMLFETNKDEVYNDIDSWLKLTVLGK